MKSEIIHTKGCFGVRPEKDIYPRMFIHDNADGYSFHVQLSDETSVKLQLSRDESYQLKSWIDEIPQYSEFKGELEKFEPAK